MAQTGLVSVFADQPPVRCRSGAAAEFQVGRERIIAADDLARSTQPRSNRRANGRHSPRPSSHGGPVRGLGLCQYRHVVMYRWA